MKELIVIGIIFYLFQASGADQAPVDAIEKKTENWHSADSKSLKEKQIKKNILRKIRLQSDIDDKAITYSKHWYNPFPSNFEILVNDQEYISLQNGKTKLHEKIINLVENTVKITYEWTLKKFGKIWHTEKKEMKFKIPPDKKEVTMKFCWEKENRIVLEDAKMIMCANIDTTEHK